MEETIFWQTIEQQKSTLNDSVIQCSKTNLDNMYQTYILLRNNLSKVIFESNLRDYNFYIDENSCKEFSEFIIENYPKEEYQQLLESPYIILQKITDFTYLHEFQFHLKNNTIKNIKLFNESSEISRCTKLELIYEALQ